MGAFVCRRLDPGDYRLACECSQSKVQEKAFQTVSGGEAEEGGGLCGPRLSSFLLLASRPPFSLVQVDEVWDEGAVVALPGLTQFSSLSRLLVLKASLHA